MSATFNQVDVNQDGVISREEFAAMTMPVATMPAVYMTAPAAGEQYMMAQPMMGGSIEAVPTYDGAGVTYVSPYVYIAPPVYVEAGAEGEVLMAEAPQVPMVEEAPIMQTEDGQFVTMAPEALTQPVTYMTPSAAGGGYTTVIVHPPVTVPAGQSVEDFMASQTLADTAATTKSLQKKMKVSKKKKAGCC
jgi:hypothetical protein